MLLCIDRAGLLHFAVSEFCILSSCPVLACKQLQHRPFLLASWMFADRVNHHALPSPHHMTARCDIAIYLNTTLLLTRSHCFRLHRTARSGEHAQQCWRGHLDVAACDTVNDGCSCPNPAGVYHHAVSHTCRPVAAQVAVLRSALTCVCVCVCVCVNVCLRLCLCACVCVCERERERESTREHVSILASF
jgi:hypothetical protein